MECPNCGSEQVKIQMVTETKRLWFTFFPAEKDYTYSEAVCQHCGFHFKPSDSVLRSKDAVYMAPTYASGYIRVNGNLGKKSSQIENQVNSLPSEPPANVVDQLVKMVDLLNSEAISKREYEILKSRLIGIEPETEPKSDSNPE